MGGERRTTDSARAEVSDTLAEGRRRAGGGRAGPLVGPHAVLALQRSAGNAAVSALLAAKLTSPGEQAVTENDAALKEIRRDEPAIDTVERGLKAAQAASVPVDLGGPKPPASALVVTTTGFGLESVAAKKPMPPPKPVLAVSRLGKVGTVAAKGSGPGGGIGKAPAAAPVGGGAETLLDVPHEAPSVQLQRVCDCGACESCKTTSMPEPVVQLGIGDARAAEAEAEKKAGHRSGSAEDVEEKFFRLAEKYPHYPFPNFSGPRDLDDYIFENPGKIDTFGGPYEFNKWVMQNPALMHPVMLSKRLNPILTAERYTAYENQRLFLHLLFTYPNRSYKFWGGRLLSRGYLRYEWEGGSSAGTKASFEPDMSNEWKAQVRVRGKGAYYVRCGIEIGGSSRVENSMTVALDRPIIVVGTREEFASESLEKAATQKDVEGNEPLFEKGSGGRFYRKPGATPFTLEQTITIINIKMGALKALRRRGKISEKDYNEAREYFEKRNKGLSEAKLPSKKLYLLSGAFVSDEYPDTVPIRAVMANNLPTPGSQLRVVLQDVTLDPKVPTKHEGAADKPAGRKVDQAAWVETELRAILDMADHWKANNDYPHGLVTLYIGSAIDDTVTFTIPISQQNWKKTARSILAPVAMVAAVGVMLVGQAEIAVPLMYVATGASLANIAFGIEQRIKNGTFGFDAALLMDVLQVVTMFMGTGAMSQAFGKLSYASKVFYLVGMGAAELTQGILLGVEAKKQIDEAFAEYQGKRALATTDDERRALQQQYEAKVADIIGGAIVSGSFIVVSSAAGVRGIKKLPKPGGSPIEGLPLRPPGQHEPPVKATDQPSKPTAEPGPRRVEAEPSVRPVASGPDAAKARAEYDAWEAKLDPDTRTELRNNSALRKTYEEMDPAVRRALTLCKSPCIPIPGPTPIEIARIKAVMKKHKIRDGDHGLREYLYRNRDKMSAAVKELEIAKTPGDLVAIYDRSIAAQASGGTAARRADGKWVFKRSGREAVVEYSVGEHGKIKKTGSASFFQSHHGIQDTWAKEVGIPGYSREDCPAILLRDSHASSPHQRATARQKGREAGRSSRTYADERANLKADMLDAGVPAKDSAALLAESDGYFAELYVNVESAMAAAGKKRAEINAVLKKYFGTWKPGAK